MDRFGRILAWISITFSLLGLAFSIAGFAGSSRPVLSQLPSILYPVGTILLVSSFLLHAQRPRLATLLMATSFLFVLPALVLTFVGMD